MGTVSPLTASGPSRLTRLPGWSLNCRREIIKELSKGSRVSLFLMAFCCGPRLLNSGRADRQPGPWARGTVCWGYLRRYNRREHHPLLHPHHRRPGGHLRLSAGLDHGVLAFQGEGRGAGSPPSGPGPQRAAHRREPASVPGGGAVGLGLYRSHRPTGGSRSPAGPGGRDHPTIEELIIYRGGTYSEIDEVTISSAPCWPSTQSCRVGRRRGPSPGSLLISASSSSPFCPSS